MTRYLCFALDLFDDRALIEEYARMHEPGAVWPGVIDRIRAQVVEAMEAMTVEVERWELLMDRFQKRLRDAKTGEKWSSLKRIFDLDAHAGTRHP